MLARPLSVGHRVHLLLQQLLIVRVHGGLIELVDRIGIRVDQVDGHTKVVLGQQLVLIVPLQPGWVVRDESLRVKRVGDELGVEGDVGQIVAILHLPIKYFTTKQMEGLKKQRSAILSVARYIHLGQPCGITVASKIG